jgi:hypothetical protein
MNRRNFLQKSSYAALAAAGLPAAIKKGSQNYPHIYKNILVSDKAGQTQCILTVFHNAIQTLSTAKPEEKFLKLEIRFHSTTNIYTPTTTGELKYSAESSDLTDKENSIWKVKTKLEQKVPDNYELPKDFPKDIRFAIKPYGYAEVLSSRGKTLVNMPYYSSYTPSDDDDCFLTTACVHHKQLADDCDELQTLRSLRDSFMLSTDEGRALIKQYHITGPAIVHAINQCENKSEIYDYMYKHMILPSVGLVKQGRLQEATDYYTYFTKALERRYK